MKNWCVSLTLLILTACFPEHQYDYPYQDPNLPVDQRVADLVSRMTLEEKISLLHVTGPAIEHLGISEYHYGNEALHGVVRPGRATVFPQAIGLAATWDPELMFQVASAISDEARAKDNENNGRMTGAEEFGGQFNGLITFFSPTVNMARDPRWGRTAETYGEDPLLTGRMGVAYIKGMQGDDEKYLKTICTPKHFVANNEEHNRFACNVIIDEPVLRNYYLKGFEACIKEGRAGAVMTAYNAINGIPCSANEWLIKDILRKEWEFDGYVVTDCGAVKHLFASHRYTTDTVMAAALAINAGVDLECGPGILRDYISRAVETGLVREITIDRAVTNVLAGRFHLGLFDPRDMVPYNSIPFEVVGSEVHKQLSLEAARKSIVLLKNEELKNGKILPLERKKLYSIAVVGPLADTCQFGDYSGTPVNPPISPLQGLRNMLHDLVEINFVNWSESHKTYEYAADEAEKYNVFDFNQEINAVAGSDIVIAFLGLGNFYERESVDKKNLDLPEEQEIFIRKLYEINQNIVVVLINGSPVSINWINDHIPAVLEAWYPGEQGGTAIAEVLSGKYNPAGRLPLTFYRSVNQLPAFNDYDITRGRTYMYLNEDPLYPFGYGLSYTRFEYSDIQTDKDKIRVQECFEINLDVKNTGNFDGEEVVQAYVRKLGSEFFTCRKKLVDFKRVNMKSGEEINVKFNIEPAEKFALYHPDLKMKYVEPGEYEIMIGSSSKDIRLRRIITVTE